MELSVVIPTLNGRDRLAAGLDALAAHAPDAEVIVVNGPSTDGTTGMIRNRDDVDVLVEVATRRSTVARNAGFEATTGDVVAFLGYDLTIEPTWLDGVTDGLGAAPVVTGPIHRTLEGGMTTETAERRRVATRAVTYFDGRNVAFERHVVAALDGFDERLDVGGDRDAAHRLAGLDYDVAWRPGMSVRQGYSADGGDVAASARGAEFRALAYCRAKNYGVRPDAAADVIRGAAGAAATAAADVLRGDLPPTEWLGTGRAVVRGLVRGAADGLAARVKDRSPARNPYGVSGRADRVVARYDWRRADGDYTNSKT